MEQETIAAYDAYSGEYDEDTEYFWDTFPVSVLDAFVKRLPGKRILNLGSGPGRDALCSKLAVLKWCAWTDRRQ